MSRNYTEGSNIIDNKNRVNNLNVPMTSRSDINRDEFV